MKKKQFNPMLIGAVVAGLAAIMFIWMAMSNMSQKHSAEVASLRAQMKAIQSKPVPRPSVPKMNNRPVVFATQPIAANTLIEPVFLETKETPVNILPGAHERVEDVVGQFASRAIGIGEPLTPNNVSRQRQKMSRRLPVGKRAIALPAVSGADSSGNFITDGDRVDLLMSYNDVGGGRRTFTVLQNVQVLYTPGPEKSEVTDGINPTRPTALTSFIVTPEEAEALVNLTQVPASQLYMILRNTEDETTFNTRGFFVPDFYDNPRSIHQRAEKSRLEWEEFNKQREEQEAKEQQDGEIPTTTEEGTSGET